MSQEIYLDWNSTTPILPEVAEAMAEAAASLWGNPASVHGAGRRARDAVESAREELAAQLERHPRDVVFTSGGTEANNLALHDAAVLIASPTEHPSVVQMAQRKQERGQAVHWLPTHPHGRVELDDIAALLDQLEPSAGVLVALSAVNHETGVIQPVEAVAELTRTWGARLHVDGVQLLGKGELGVLRLADSVSFAAHKIRGPKGIGALVFDGRPPRPYLVGGAQERGLRPGTQDAVLALGFRLALLHAKGGPGRNEQLRPLRDRLESRLSDRVLVNGSEPRVPHVSNVSFRSFPGPELVAALDLLGVQVASGSACSAGTSEPSKVVAAMLGTERAKGAVRFSLGENTTETQVEAAIASVFQILGT